MSTARTELSPLLLMLIYRYVRGSWWACSNRKLYGTESRSIKEHLGYSPATSWPKLIGSVHLDADWASYRNVHADSFNPYNTKRKE